LNPVPCGEDDDRNAPVFGPKVTQDVQSILAGQPEVEDDKIELPRESHKQRVVAIGRN
jgi:hypothetical protein